jgi:hypothetical protein
MEVTLQPGDVLYFPRGFIHEACTQAGDASTHLTVSTYQKTTWADFLLQAAEKAIEKAAAVDVRFRQGLPLQYLHFLGSGLDHLNSISSAAAAAAATTAAAAEPHLHTSFFDAANAPALRARQQQFTTQFLAMWDHVRAFLNVHHAADHMSADFYSSRLPPFPDQPKIAPPTCITTASTTATRMSPIPPRLRLIEPTALRMMVEPDPEEDGTLCIFLATSTDNAHEYHMDGRYRRAPELMKLPIECACAVGQLLGAGRLWLQVADLTMSATLTVDEAADMRSQLVEALREAKLVVVEDPEEVVNDD